MSSSLAPNMYSMGSMINQHASVKMMPRIMLSVTVFPSTWLAVSYFFCPRRTLMSVLAPTPIMAPTAMLRFMKGKVVVRPWIASTPTPCPMKKRSTRLYRELAVIAMMAGRA